MKYLYLFFIIFFILSLKAQEVPAIYSNLSYNSSGELILTTPEGKEVVNTSFENLLTLEKLQGNISGNEKGLLFDFADENFKGEIFYGFIPYGDSKHPYPVYFKRTAKIENGKAFIEVANLQGKYDMIQWEKKGFGTLGYRITDEKGTLLYDGKVTFEKEANENFKVGVTITEGPFINQLEANQVIISFNTNFEAIAQIEINGKIYQDENPTTQHEILINDLKPSTKYDYAVIAGNDKQSYSFETAPALGSRTNFTFAYASDSRNGQGGGERNLFGANFYIMKKMLALATQQKVKFMQFTGDLITGYSTEAGEMDLQYANWKRAVEPFAHYFPIYTTMGNHEALNFFFSPDASGSYRNSYSIDKFPFKTESAEAIYGKNFVNYQNGPESEDGAVYDPNPNQMDFPSYKENVYFYTYDNVAMVVLNSDYWYAPSTSKIPHSSGGLHAYIMDMQFEWLEQTIQDLENNANIDHIFITEHTPFFPNGGHVKDDMWYNGSNEPRPFVAGKPLEKGIIERRDELLDLLINRSSKVRAILTGDEHNYARTEISPEINIYPEDWQGEEVQISRTIWQINNGAAGAPYYAQEQTPWTDWVQGFTTQNALVLINVSGESIIVQVLNPDTLEEVDAFVLK